METKEPQKTEVSKRPTQTKLRSQEWNGRTYIGVDFPWRERELKPMKSAAQQVRFFDQVLAMAELPKHHEWPKILLVSQEHEIPSIWNRVRPSPLESSAAALLSALAFSNHRNWPQLVSSYFKSHNLTPGLVRGRPRLHPRYVKDMNRGIQIGKLIEQLEKGFEIKLRVRQGGGFASGDDRVAKELRSQGHGDKEIKAILKGKTSQDAGCQLYLATNGVRENVTLKGIRNSYARYKLLSVTNPPLHRKSLPSGKDSQ